jgi:hypothetical protein
MPTSGAVNQAAERRAAQRLEIARRADDGAVK